MSGAAPTGGCASAAGTLRREPGASRHVLGDGRTRLFVISLPDARRRRDLVEAQLDQPGMPEWQFVDGVDGRQIGAADLARVYDGPRARAHLGRDLRPAEIGCALSHVEALKRIVATGAPFGLVLEDDALLGCEFPTVLDRLSSALDAARPDLVLLSHVARYYGLGSRKLLRHHRLHGVYRCYGAHAYMVSATAAASLLRGLTPVWTFADDWVTFRRQGLADLRCVVPYCVGLAPASRVSQVVSGAPHPSDTGMGSWIRRKLLRNFVSRISVEPVLFVRAQARTW